MKHKFISIFHSKCHYTFLNAAQKVLVSFLSYINFVACSNSGPYLCGHYHTVFNLVQHMYAMHDDNALELELGDFKENRKFRVLSIDHGLLNFIDVTFKVCLSSYKNLKGECLMALGGMREVAVSTKSPK